LVVLIFEEKRGKKQSTKFKEHLYEKWGKEMQAQLSRDQKNLEKEITSARPFLWSRSGPVFLLVAFAALLFKCAPFYWPLLLMVFVGYSANRLWKRRGFYFSLMALAAVSIGMIQSGIDPFWSSLLSTSIALSWLLIFLGRQETEAFILNREEKIEALEENCRFLEKQLRDAKASLLEKNKEGSAERERLNDLYAQSLLTLNEVKYSLEVSEKEREKITEKCGTLSQDILAHRQNEIAFQQALEDAQAQLLKLKDQQMIEAAKVVATNIVPQEEIDLQEKMQLVQAQQQYALLREQFDEKSEALDKARKELFRVENELLSLQKACEEKAYEIAEEDLFLFKDLQMLEEESRDLEAQVASLQNFISSLLSPKKRSPRKVSASVEEQERLPLLIQEKIDQATPVDSAPN
jgi:hypothetical protein